MAHRGGHFVIFPFAMASSIILRFIRSISSLSEAVITFSFARNRRFRKTVGFFAAGAASGATWDHVSCDFMSRFEMRVALDAIVFTTSEI